ncbi:hypothetical protein CR513_24254, partial [Mucuna pruriens]
MYLYLLHSKDGASNAFKIVRFDRGEKYYDKYNGNAQALGLFTKHLVTKRLETKFVTYTRLGCLSEVRIYNLQEKKLNPKIISGYFIGYTKQSQGHRFYPSTHNTRIVELRNAKFLENDLISRRQFQDIDHYEAQSSISSNRKIFIHISQVQTGVRHPTIKVPQVVENDLVDQIVDEEQQDYVEQQ